MTASSRDKFQCQNISRNVRRFKGSVHRLHWRPSDKRVGSRDTREEGKKKLKWRNFFSFFLPHALRVRASCRLHRADWFLIECHVKFRQTKIYRCTWSVTRETHTSVAALFTPGNCLSRGVYYTSFLSILISMKNIDRTH